MTISSPILLTCSRIVLMVFFATVITLNGCHQADENDNESGQQGAATTPRDQEMREKRAMALLARARNFYSPVDRIEKLVDVAHVYHDTIAGPQAWGELIFYLLDHSNNDYERAARELVLFSRRCPDSSELLTACLLQYNATLKPALVNPALESGPRRRELAAEGLKLWCKVGEHLCGLQKFANDYGAHLETGNAYVFARKFADAERIWAKIEKFTEPAEDAQRMTVLMKRADILRTQGGDRGLAKRLYLKVREYQDKMPEHIHESHRKWVDDALKELEGVQTK